MTTTIPNGTRSSVKVARGRLREYSTAEKPLMLTFEFNPSIITRTRSVTVKLGSTPATRGGYDFAGPEEAPRASQGVSVNAETFSLKLLLDATDRMNAGDEQANHFGIQPEIDTLRSMVEPKTQTREGARTLAALGRGEVRAFARHEYASVLVFEWGPHSLPVFMTQVRIDVKFYLPNLYPYRAEADLSLQVIESVNKCYMDEIKRQFASARRNVGASQGFEWLGRSC